MIRMFVFGIAKCTSGACYKIFVQKMYWGRVRLFLQNEFYTIFYIKNKNKNKNRMWSRIYERAYVLKVHDLGLPETKNSQLLAIYRD